MLTANLVHILEFVSVSVVPVGLVLGLSWENLQRVEFLKLTQFWLIELFLIWIFDGKIAHSYKSCEPGLLSKTKKHAACYGSYHGNLFKQNVSVGLERQGSLEKTCRELVELQV